MKRKFQMDAKLAAQVGDMALVGDVGGDLFTIPGEFNHPMHGKFTMGFIGSPPQLIILHANSRRVGMVEIQPMLEVLAQQAVKKLHG